MQSIKIDDELYEQAREDAAREKRSIAAQIAYYFEIGRAISRSPFFSQDDIDRALAGGIEVGELSNEEQEAFFAQYARNVQNGGLYTADFWADRRAKGLGVGALEDGTIVRALPGGSHEVLTA